MGFLIAPKLAGKIMAGLTMLLVDDDWHTQNIFALIAAFHGSKVTIVKDAESALNYLERHRPDLIVLDLYLDGVDGFQILRLIRNSPLDPCCPIVATTAYFTPMTLSWSVLSGFDGYLEKPFKVESLWPFCEALARGWRNTLH